MSKQSESAAEQFEKMDKVFCDINKSLMVLREGVNSHEFDSLLSNDESVNYVLRWIQSLKEQIQIFRYSSDLFVHFESKNLEDLGFNVEQLDRDIKGQFKLFVKTAVDDAVERWLSYNSQHESEE